MTTESRIAAALRCGGKRWSVAFLASCALAAPVAGQQQVGAPSVIGRFDQNRNGRLDVGERREALAFLRAQPPARDPFAGRVPWGTPAPGRRLAAADVAHYPTIPFYADTVVRTIFLDFADADWEDQLEVLKEAKVDVPATMTIDGTRYPEVGVRFRGASSFRMVPTGWKRSLNVSVDWANDSQSVQGSRTLNLLNAHVDFSFLRSFLFFKIAREYGPAPRASFVRVVINGESWGLYVSVEQFDKEFLRHHLGSTTGARWKAPGGPQAQTGLQYFGNSLDPYRTLFEIKSKDDTASWRALVELSRVLNQTPISQLEGALAPILDVDAALRFLALDVALANADGYWKRASDYQLYRDPAGRFQFVTQDANETFWRGSAPDLVRTPNTSPTPESGASLGVIKPGPGAAVYAGPTLDPLVGLDDPRTALRHRLLAVPELQSRYLAYVREIAERWLDPVVFNGLVDRYEALIREDILTDTRKLMNNATFIDGLAELRRLTAQRHQYLLEWKPPI